MTSFVHTIYSVVHVGFRLLFAPFQSWNPLWPLALVSLLTALIMLWVYGKVSNQDEIRQVKNRIRGELLAVRLYQHDIRVILGVQAGILRKTLQYMRLAFFPMLVLIVPVFLILVQLNLYFSKSPLNPGDQTILKVQLHPDNRLHSEFELDCPSGLSLDSPAVRSNGGRQIAWRLRALEPGHHRVVLHVGDESVSKEVVVGSGWSAVPNIRSSRLGEVLLFAGEPPIERGSSVERIEVQHPDLPLPFWGIELHWLVVFFVLSVVFSFLFKNAAGVEL